MSKKLTSFLLASSMALSPLVCSAATADETILLPDAALTEASQPEALWRVIARGEAKVSFKDNLYKAKADKESDLITRAKPEATIVSNLDRHALKVSGALDAATYASESDNNFVDGRIDATGRYDVNDTISIHPTALWRDDHVDIGSFEDAPETRNLEPTDYRYGEAGATLDIHPEAYLIQLGGLVDFYNYDNAKRNNGTININDDRDRKETGGWTKLGYKVQPDMMIYTLGGIDQRSYNDRVDGTLLHGRDSDGRTLRLGTQLGDKNDFRWLDINAGYMNRNYDDDFYPDVTTLGLTADGHYQIAADWHLELSADRTIEENTLTGISSFIKSTVRTEVAYHLTPRTEIAANIRFTENDFQANTSLGLLNRVDKTYDIGTNARYKLTDIYKFDLGYNYTKRTSNNADVEYSGNVFTLGLIASIN